MLSAVNPRSAGRGGGAFEVAPLPTGVGGTLRHPGAFAASPAGVPFVDSSGIKEARNNSGSNVRVPYARLVSMHGRSSAGKGGPREMVVNGQRQMEYDGLRSGELAWILGRRHSVSEPTDYQDTMHAGRGFGVDRVQRLASTAWMEQMLKGSLGNKSVALHDIALDNEQPGQDNGLTKWATGASALYCPDIVRSILLAGGHSEGDADAATGGNRFYGVNVLESGPFLRGMQFETDAVSIAPKNADMAAKYPQLASLPRNAGDMCAVAAVEDEIRKASLMDWSPDGIVLSKLESPTDSPLSSAEMDAQQAQLFNLGVQGPCITTAWTSDVRDHKLECQPMDRVFICIVADLAWSQSRTADIAPDVLTDYFGDMEKHHKGIVERAVNSDALGNTARASGRKLREALRDRAPRPYFEELSSVIQDPASTVDEKNKAKAELQGWKDAPIDKAVFETIQSDFRKGKGVAGKAFLTNFRLKRSTSSHMVNYSKYKPGDANSRCSEPFFKPIDIDGLWHGAASYIVGAWCVGTVLDSAASRSTVGGATRTAPASMALNINVNVSWWSGDKLYKHYMDRSVVPRGKPYEVVDDATKKRKFDAGEIDVNA